MRLQPANELVQRGGWLFGRVVTDRGGADAPNSDVGVGEEEERDLSSVPARGHLSQVDNEGPGRMASVPLVRHMRDQHFERQPPVP